MKKRALMSLLLILISPVLIGCGSNSEDSDDSGGGYISCVFELMEAKKAGIISATTQEIQEECSQQQLP
jgi:hypothetical protein